MSTRPRSVRATTRRNHAMQTKQGVALGLTCALLLCGAFAPMRVSATDPAPRSPARVVPVVDAAWLAQLATRAEQLARLLLSAMSAAHDQGELANARCFDGALKELHSLQRQVAFHGERVLDPALAAPDRERHTRALVLNNARLDYVAQSTSRCGDADASVKHGQTRVETYFEDGAIR